MVCIMHVEVVAVWRLVMGRRGVAVASARHAAARRTEVNIDGVRV